MSAGRKYWTPREWREQFEAQDCACQECGNTEGPFIAEHELPNYFAPGKPSCILCKRCAAAKTTKDRGDIARCKRLNGETSSQASRRAERKSKGIVLWRSKPMSLKRRPRTREEILSG